MTIKNPIISFWHIYLKADPAGVRLTHAFKVALIFAVSGALFFILHRPQFQWAIVVATLLPDLSLGMSSMKAKQWNLLLSGIVIALLIFFLTILGQTSTMLIVATFVSIFLVFSLMLFGLEFFPHGPYFAIFIFLALAYPGSTYEAFNRMICALIGTGIAFALYFYFPIFNINLLMARNIVRKAIHDLTIYTETLTNKNEKQLDQHRIESFKSLSAFEQTLQNIQLPTWRIQRGKKAVNQIWNLRRDLTLWQQLMRSYSQLTLVSTLILNNLHYNLKHLHLPYRTFSSRPLFDDDTQKWPPEAVHCLIALQTHYQELENALAEKGPNV